MTALPATSPVGWRAALRSAPRTLTNLAVGCVVPPVLFMTGSHMWGTVAGIGLSVGWNCSCQLARGVLRKPLSGLLLLGLVELTIRTSVSLATHSVRLFFLIPAVATAATGVVYITSRSLSGLLLTAVIADLVPPSVVDLSTPPARQIIRKVSILYGSEQMVVATISILMLLRLSASQYVAAHMIASWLSFGVAATVGVLALRGEVSQLLARDRLRI